MLLDVNTGAAPELGGTARAIGMVAAFVAAALPRARHPPPQNPPYCP
jgi:hypothetical protein